MNNTDTYSYFTARRTKGRKWEILARITWPIEATSCLAAAETMADALDLPYETILFQSWVEKQKNIAPFDLASLPTYAYDAQRYFDYYYASSTSETFHDAVREMAAAEGITITAA